MMQNDFLVKIKKELYEYQNIPKDLSNYIISVIKEDKENPLLLPRMKNRTYRKKVWEKIDYQFKKAMNITNLLPVALLKALDFHSKDVSLCKFDAMWAELRTIFFLSDLGLYDICPLEAKNNEKSADFIAKGNSHKYTIEVFCKIEKKIKNITEMPRNISNRKLKKISQKIIPSFKPDTNIHKLSDQYIDKAKEKKQQLIETAKNYSCNKNIMVMVLNDLNISPTLDCCEYKEILKRISTDLNWGCKYHFAIVTGLTDLLNDRIDNFIYPPI